MTFLECLPSYLRLKIIFLDIIVLRELIPKNVRWLPMQNKLVLSVSEVAGLLGVSSDSIYAMVREGQIPHIRIRRRILFHQETIHEWLRQGCS
jgi:excisionase family DNA binding protein